MGGKQWVVGIRIAVDLCYVAEIAFAQGVLGPSRSVVQACQTLQPCACERRGNEDRGMGTDIALI